MKKGSSKKLWKGESWSSAASALLHFVHFVGLMLLFMLHSPWPRPSTAALLLINATHFRYRPSVTTIILLTSLRSLMSRRKYSPRGFYSHVFRSLCPLFCSFVLLLFRFNKLRNFSFVYSIRSNIFLIDTLCRVWEWLIRSVGSRGKVLPSA